MTIDRRDFLTGTAALAASTGLAPPALAQAPVAQLLYTETPESVAAREQAAAARRLAPEPAHTIDQGRPTKRDRRALDDQRRTGWDERWSASIDEPGSP